MKPGALPVIMLNGDNVASVPAGTGGPKSKQVMVRWFVEVVICVDCVEFWVLLVTEPAKSSQYKRCKKTSTRRLQWSDTCLHLLAVGSAKLMLEVWINSDATHLVIRYRSVLVCVRVMSLKSSQNLYFPDVAFSLGHAKTSCTQHHFTYNECVNNMK